jgi:hypothetical protein
MPCPGGFETRPYEKSIIRRNFHPFVVARQRHG